MKLTKEEAQLLLSKLEYRFKKTALKEMETKEYQDFSDGAKLVHKLAEVVNK